MPDKEIVIGHVGVDSGQLVICDPAYLSRFQDPDSGEFNDHAHEIYVDVEDGSMWQFCYGSASNYEGVNSFPGTYETIIPKYGKHPNELIRSGRFVRSNVDPTPHIPNGEFSYRGICKATSKELYAEVDNGTALAFRAGLGDGRYEIRAIISEVPNMGTRVKRVIIDLVPEYIDMGQ